MREKLLRREKECIDFLNAIPGDAKYVLIGGYAVSSFGFPRFSVDLDITIPEEDTLPFEDLIRSRGFKLTTEKTDVDETYAGEFRKYQKRDGLPVSVDLLINSVKSRQTGSSYSFDYIFRNSETKTVFGWHPDSNADVRVADRELLLALKINSMRLTDKRDIIVLCYEKPDAKKVAEHLKRCPKDKIKEHIEDLLSLIYPPQNVDSIKGVFAVSDDVVEKAAANCKRMTLRVMSILRLHG